MWKAQTHFICLLSLIVALGGLVACSHTPPRTTTPDIAAPWKLVDPSFVEQYAKTFRYRLGWPKAFRVSRDGRLVFFLRSTATSFSHDLFVYDVATKTERRVLTAAKVLQGGEEVLSAAERARRERMRVVAKGISSFRLSRQGDKLLVPLSGQIYLVGYPSLKVSRLALGSGPAPIDARFSPNGRHVSYVRGGDLYLLPLPHGPPRRLTRRSGPHETNGLAEFVAQEEMGRFRGYWWSPQSDRIVFQRTDVRGVERMHILDPLHPEREPQSWAYPRAGKSNARVRLFSMDLAGGDVRELIWDQKKYPYLARVCWTKGAPLSLVVQDRPQRELLLLAADPLRGGTRLLVHERDPAWVNIDRQMPRWRPDGKAFLWSSEQGGFKQLFLHGANGRRLRALTAPADGYRRLLDYDAKRGRIVFSGGGRAVETHIYEVSTDSKGQPKRLSQGAGEHHAIFGRSHTLYVHQAATMKGKRVYVRQAAGNELGVIQSRGATPPFLPRPRLLAVRLGAEAGPTSRTLWSMMLRPRGKQVPGKSYPVIVYVYAGPGYRTVRSDPMRYLMLQWIADQGFIVVSIDGRGTPHRGRNFERATKGNFIRLQLADQVAGLRALGRMFPEMDLSRVGVYGWSYGGYATTMALMLRPDVYHAGVAGAPVTEWRDYDTHYTERYGGLVPANAAGYDDSSALTHAAKLRRPLLLVHGTADDNVYFSHSVKLVRALFRAGRPVEFLPLAGFTHVVPEPTTQRRLYERIVQHFKRHLTR